MKEEEVGRSQTTKGVWMAPNDAGNILVFDIEGTDSKERGEQRLVSQITLYDLLQMVERMISLFALAIADVLIINMWTHDVGRYDACNYGMLKDIFEVNLRLFD